MLAAHRDRREIDVPCGVRRRDRRPPDLFDLIRGQLELLEADFEAGAIAAVTPAGVRVRRLPLR